jgi:peptidoglycan/LPS O-acetylase OafA/YrhL
MLGIPVSDYILTNALFGIVFLSALYWFLFSFRYPKTTKPEKDRLVLFDFVKGISIIGIISLHATDFVPKMIFLKEFLWAAIPIFILVSGYLLAKRHPKGVNLKEYSKGIFFRILLIYAFFVLLDAIIFGRFSLLFFDLISGQEGNLYFIPLIIQFYLIFPALIRFKERITGITSVLVVFLVTVCFWFLNDGLQIQSFNSNLFSLLFFGRFLIFFVFGIYLAGVSLEKLKSRDLASIFIGFVALNTGLFFVSNSWWSLVYPIPVFFMLVLASRIISAFKLFFIQRTFAELGKHTLVIYLVHYTFLRAATFYFSGISGYFQYIADVLAVTLASYVFSVLFMRAYTRLLTKTERPSKLLRQ